MFLNVCKQTFHITHVRISQKVKGVSMWNLQHIILIWSGRCWLIFKSALVYLNQHFLCIFFSCIYFREMWLFGVYLFSQMPFKRKFRVHCEIDQNSRNWRKYVHAKVSTLKVSFLNKFHWTEIIFVQEIILNVLTLRTVVSTLSLGS